MATLFARFWLGFSCVAEFGLPRIGLLGDGDADGGFAGVESFAAERIAEGDFAFEIGGRGVGVAALVVELEHAFFGVGDLFDGGEAGKDVVALDVAGDFFALDDGVEVGDGAGSLEEGGDVLVVVDAAF